MPAGYLLTGSGSKSTTDVICKLALLLAYAMLACAHLRVAIVATSYRECPPQWTVFASKKQGFNPTLRLVQNAVNSRYFVCYQPVLCGFGAHACYKMEGLEFKPAILHKPCSLWGVRRVLAGPKCRKSLKKVVPGLSARSAQKVPKKSKKSRKSQEKVSLWHSFSTFSALFWHSGPTGPGRPF